MIKSHIHNIALLYYQEGIDAEKQAKKPVRELIKGIIE